MTTNSQSWVNGVTEKEAFPLQSASKVAEMYNILGDSQSKYIIMLLVCYTLILQSLADCGIVA